MNSAIQIQPVASYQGWHAKLKLSFKPGVNKTVLAERLRFGPLTLQRALYPEGDVCHVYILHPPGGVVGGDKLDIDINVTSQAHALLTTPGATKFYRSVGPKALQVQQFNVEDDAILEWLPQENIFFPGAIVRNQLHLNLAATAKAAVWEIQCFGRPVVDENFDTGSLDSQWKIIRDGKPLLLERLRVDPVLSKRLSQLQGHAVSGTFVLTGVNKDQLQEMRDRITTNTSEYLAMTLLDDLLIVRYLGDSTENARTYFVDIWSQLRAAVLDKAAIIPRIWNT